MFANSNEINNAIGQALIDSSTGKDWIEIVLDIEMGIESVELSEQYLSTDGEIKYISLFDNDFGLFDNFRKLHQTMTAQTDKHKWNRAKVTLSNDMQLNIKFEWDQELADELERLSKEN
jgi:hypothetical protein